jgi:O-antigen ligase
VAVDSTQATASAVSRWWLTACVLTLIVASDYQLRNRPPEDALAAAIDVTILFEVGLYGLVAAYLLFAHGAPLRLRSVHPVVYFAALWIGLMVLSLTYTPYPQYAVVRVGQMVVVFALTAIAAGKATRADFHRLAHGFMVLVALSIAYGVVIPSVPVNQRQVGRFTWFAIHPTVSGILAGMATLMALAYVASGRRARPGPMWSQAVYLGLLGVSTAALLAAQTRGAIGGVVVGAMVLLVASRRDARSRVEMILAGMVTVAVIALVAPAQVSAYFTRGERPDEIATLSSRTDLWSVALDAFGQNPIFGYGVTSSRGLFYDETGLGGGHNAVINTLVELGIVGIAVWGTLIWLVVRGIWRLPRTGSEQLIIDRALLLALMAFLVVDGMFYEGIGAVTNVASMWFLMCLAWMRTVQRTSAEREEASALRAMRADARPL